APSHCPGARGRRRAPASPRSRRAESRRETAWRVIAASAVAGGAAEPLRRARSPAHTVAALPASHTDSRSAVAFRARDRDMGRRADQGSRRVAVPATRRTVLAEEDTVAPAVSGPAKERSEPRIHRRTLRAAVQLPVELVAASQG